MSHWYIPVTPLLIFSDLLFGRVHKIVVRIESLKLGEGVVPSLETIRAKGGSLAVRNCLNELWKAKDKFISKIHSEAELNAETTQPTRESIFHRISWCQQHHSFFFRIGSKYQHLRFKAGNTFGGKIQHCRYLQAY